MTYVGLTIAGSDPSGGAGIQADLKTFHQWGIYGTSVITLLTVQNTQRVTEIQILSPQLVDAQLQAVLDDVPPAAAKTGALGNAEIVRLIGERAASFSFPLVVDPVMISKQGVFLLRREAVHALKELLIPKAFLVTPNLHEASELAGIAVRSIPDMEEAARRISGLGARAVLVKGGHLPGEATDVLYSSGKILHYPAPRVSTVHTHGTGCTYSAAITAQLARGRQLDEAVAAAKRFITLAIQSSPGLGKGAGPVNHHARVD
jgi:hydroxymethylpyrimidine/phosphomethylpyrimidine kinase